MIDYPVTPLTIALAKAYQLAERDRFTLETGIPLDAEGRPILPDIDRYLVIVINGWQVIGEDHETN